MTSRAVWDCPECGDKITATADYPELARAAIAETIREHALRFHVDQPNAAAQALSSWLAPPLGTVVHLWGGPFDGGSVWMPADQAPDTIGVHLTPAGKLVVLHPATWHLRPDVESYSRPPGDPGLRYTHQPRRVQT